MSNRRRAAVPRTPLRPPPPAKIAPPHIGSAAWAEEQRRALRIGVRSLTDAHPHPRRRG